MGFTRYWNIKETASAEKFAAAMDDITEMLAEEDACDTIRFECDIDEPWKVDKTIIRFNGIEEDGHETFCIEYGDTGFDFCKTARKPYDKYVYACLLILKRHLGGDIDISSDGENDYDDLAQQLADLYYSQGYDQRNKRQAMEKYAYVVVMEDGKIVKWTGKAEDEQHAEGLATAYAQERNDGQVFDTAKRP